MDFTTDTQQLFTPITTATQEVVTAIKESKPEVTPTTTWHTLHIPTGAYDIEDIDEVIREEIEQITGPNIVKDLPGDRNDKYPIEIHAKESSLNSIIEVNSPTYAVDIYNSSLRTLLGYPENHPGVISWKDLPKEPDRDDPAHAAWLKKLPLGHPRLPEPKISDLTTDKLPDGENDSSLPLNPK